jgi:NADH dehydrogenase FAD-containing subunit
VNNQNKDVIIVGSGLSAFGAIRAAIKTKARVTVIDIGNLLPSSLKDKVSEIDKENTGYVHKEIYRISTEEESTSLTGKNLPKKTVFGSKFFYQEVSYLSLRPKVATVLLGVQRSCHLLKTICQIFASTIKNF